MTNAQKGDTVRVHYKGLLSDGSVFDTSEGQQPLEFTLGENAVIAGFESAVEGMAVGDTVAVTLPPEQAYGTHNEELLLEVSRDQFPDDIDPEPGMVVNVRSQDGMDARFTIVQVADESVILDGNHPLAGKALTFEIELVDIV